MDHPLRAKGLTSAQPPQFCPLLLCAVDAGEADPTCVPGVGEGQHPARRPRLSRVYLIVGQGNRQFAGHRQESLRDLFGRSGCLAQRPFL